MTDTISERRDFNLKMYQEAQILMMMWIEEMKKIIVDPEARCSSDFSNIQKFLKDNNVVIDIPMPIADQNTAAALLAQEDLPSYMTSKDNFMMKEGM